MYLNVYRSTIYRYLAKTWKQHKCPLRKEWIKMWYLHEVDYYSAIEKNEIMPFAAIWIDQEIIILNEVVRQRKTNIWFHLYMESKKTKDTNELIYKAEIDSQT